MTTEFTLKDCIALAEELHAGQFDKAGRPYTGHLERVARKVRMAGGDWIQEMAAWLHDSIEDTTATPEYLQGRGVPEAVVNPVIIMTHYSTEDDEEYWAWINQNPRAKLIKHCDMHDNLDPERMCYLTPEQQAKGRRKYGKAFQILA
jgi:(p)ppGpp synthase/HD superfamily hydrolase